MRRPVVSYALAVIALLGISRASQAQETSFDPVQFVPRVQASVGYQFIHANAPPGVNQKFNLNGGYAAVDVKYKFWLSFTGEFTGTHANQISALGQNLTLMTYTAGPRVTFRRRRTVPFAQVLVGGAHGSNSYFPTATSYTTSANTFALQAGGGIDFELSHRFAVRAIEAQYLHTGFNNGVNTSQNQLMLGAGLMFKFHGRYAMPHTHAKNVPPPPAEPPLAPPPPPTPQQAEAAPVAPPSTTDTTNASAPTESDFHDHVSDAFFDYDKADLRPDAQQVLQTTAAYLKQHPGMHVLIGGYSDERGTQDYNLSLGEKRANAARDALVQMGIDASRLSIVSYGKGAQVCTKPTEPCFQRNRRVALMPQP